MKKKWIVAIVIFVLLIGLGFTKYFTMIFDNKSHAMVINKDWGPDAKDLKNDVESSENVFIAEVYESLGSEKYKGIPYSLYKARITLNIKGRMLDDPIIAIPGGYYKEGGKLKLLKYNTQGQLKTKQVYRFITRHTEDKEWLVVTPYIGVYNMKNEEEKWEDVKILHDYLGVDVKK